MTHDISPARALLSVSDKTGIVELATMLAAHNIELLSTGGTAQLLRDEGLAVTDVSDYTGCAEMMDGRVKTLHPKVHGGILALRDNRSHRQAMTEHDIAPIDMVIINLYPFEETVAKHVGYDETVEQIDIGGPAMIRAAAKNHGHVLVVTDPQDYLRITKEMEEQGGKISYALRQKMAYKAFARTAAYDTAISAWFSHHEVLADFPPYFADGHLKQILRYGENPHQKAAFYTSFNAPAGVATARQLQGKELSYNNINDTDAAWRLVSEFSDPAVAIIKHANPCCVAISDCLDRAFKKALVCDATSAFGGILAVNREVDDALVEAIGALFLEVIIAPSITDSAKQKLSKKKNLRVLITERMPDPKEPLWQVKSIKGGYLVQHNDYVLADETAFNIATMREPTKQELQDLKFAHTVCKHVKSNAIIFAKDGATVGVGAGQMSRVDSVRLAGWKAGSAELSIENAVMASDAFFPFDDNIHYAAEMGIKAIIQPGGSIRDQEVIDAANHYDMAMILTGERHFNH